MNPIKCYNAYINIKMRLLNYVLYPALVIIAAVIVVGLLKNVGMVQGLFVMVPAATLMVSFFVDIYTFGAVYENWGKDEELLKSSEAGAKI